MIFQQNSNMEKQNCSSFWKSNISNGAEYFLLILPISMFRIDENRVQESLKESNKVHKLSYDDLRYFLIKTFIWLVAWINQSTVVKVQFRVRFDDLINDASNDSINQLLIRVLSTSSSSLHPVDPDEQDDRSTRSCRSARRRDDEKEDRDDFKRSLRKVLVQSYPSVLWLREIIGSWHITCQKLGSP